MRYDIVDIKLLKPLELVFPGHLSNLEAMINNDGYLLKALIADRATGTILDGSHRYVYLLKNGFIEAPVYFVDYMSEDVRVGTRLKHRFLIKTEKGISKSECLIRSRSGDLFLPRTTRHFFTFRKESISLPLSSLKKSRPVDVSRLIYDVDINVEIEHNRRYVEEIDEETKIIVQYLAEEVETKHYIERQINLMDENRQIAFFPGKFHPPHIGQINTILNLVHKYKKIIIGVTEHQPENAVTTPKVIVDSLIILFQSFNNVEIVLIKGVLVEKKDTKDLPLFDVLLSGNTDVLEWAKKMKVSAKYVERSGGFNCSGTNVRSLLND